MNVVITPFSRLALGIASAGCRQFQHKSGSRLAQVNAALRHLHVQLVFRCAALQHHRHAALLQETVCIYLRSPRNAHRLRPYAVSPHTHGRRGRCRVIRHKVKSHLLILAGFNSRGQMVVRKNASVTEGQLRADIRGVLSGLQNVKVDALALQRQLRARLHLGDDLHRVPADAHSRHRQGETAVRRAASFHRLRVPLVSVQIQRHGFVAASAHRKGDAHRLAHTVAALGYTLGYVEAAAQRKGHSLHAHIALPRLCLAGGRVGCGSPHIDVCRSEQQVFRQIQGIGSLAHIMLRVCIHHGRAPLHLNADCCLLTRGCAFLVTAAVLVVIRPCQHRAVTFLYDGLADGCIQHDFRGRSVTASTAASCRNVRRRYLRTALVGQCQAHAAAVVTQFGVHAQDGARLYLHQLRRHRRVLHRVRRTYVQALVHLRLADGDSNVAVLARLQLLAVQRHALHRAVAAKVLPARRLLPALDVRALELLGLPFALCRLVCDAASLRTCLPFHGCYGGLKRIVSALKRNLLRHVIGVATAASAYLHQVLFLIAPHIHHAAAHIRLVLQYLRAHIVHVHVCARPVIAVYVTILPTEGFVHRVIVHTVYLGA